MNMIREVFNNRELALCIWFIILFSVLLFIKPARQQIQQIFKILFRKRIIILFFVLLSYSSCIIFILYKIGIWNWKYIKDLVCWVLFVEIPIFFNIIANKTDAHFFRTLIMDNLKATVIIDFLINFWTFSLIIELLLVPIIFVISAVCAVAERENAAQKIHRFSHNLTKIASIGVSLNIIYHLIYTPGELFNCDTLISFFLPQFLLICNLPILYGFALQNTYEVIFNKLKINKQELLKKKILLFKFAGLNLCKLMAIRKNLKEVILCNPTIEELKLNLCKLQRTLDSK